MSLSQICEGAVVVGTDGSDDAHEAVRWAAEQAELEHRALAVVHAGSDRLPASDADPSALRAAMRAEAEQVLERSAGIAAEHRPSVEVRTALVVDDPRTVLLEASRSAHLLVLGSRGRGPVRSLLLGSVGVAISQHARCPVVVRRPHDPAETGRGVLVGSDGTPASDPALEWAFALAERRGMPLCVVRTAFGAYPTGPVPDDEPGHEAQREELARTVAGPSARHPDVQVTRLLWRGLADEALVAAGVDYDMVVLGAHVRRSILGLLDLNVTKGVLVHAPRLVAVVHAPEQER